VRRMPGRRRRCAIVGVDGTGLSPCAASSYFIRRSEHFGQPRRSWKHWLKWLAVVDLKRQLILSQKAWQAPWNDCATLPTLVSRAQRRTPIGRVLADAEFDSERNHTFCRQQLQAMSVIPSSAAPVAGPRVCGSKCGNISPPKILSPRTDRKRLLGRQAETLCSRTGQNSPYSVPPGLAARPSLRYLPLQAACLLTPNKQDVNRARQVLVGRDKSCISGRLFLGGLSMDDESIL
jgi:hypothetical protein